MKTTLGDLFGDKLRALVKQEASPPTTPKIEIEDKSPPATFDEGQLVGDVLDWLVGEGLLRSTEGLQQRFFASREP